MILLGSASDLNIANKATDVLENLGIYYDVRVASAHRTHKKVKEIVLESTEAGVDVFLAIAGLSAHLSGIIAANTHKPVVGVPVDVKLGGLDALFASVQMPFGVPVATVGIDSSENGAILASQIIGVFDKKIADKISVLRDNLALKIHRDELEVLKNFNGNFYSPISQNSKNNELKTQNPNKNDSVDVSVIAGSYSDIKIARNTTNILEKMEISYDFNVLSPLRYPKKFENYLKQNFGVKLYIAITGLTAHVTGAIAAYTEKPVIGVPCSINLCGMDALFSMVNMPPGVPVATLGINKGRNAALLAAEILGIGNQKIKEHLIGFKTDINSIQ
jgi:5-(carboxyamino)imidazole ribonucleotide mutase